MRRRTLDGRTLCRGRRLLKVLRFAASVRVVGKEIERWRMFVGRSRRRRSRGGVGAAHHLLRLVVLGV